MEAEPSGRDLEAPYVTGVLPRDDIVAFLAGEVVPGRWPGCRLDGVELRRLRFTPGEECAALATLALDPAAKEAPRVVITFAPEAGLLEASSSGEPPGVTLSRRLGCLAEVFPADWRLPDLPGVLDASAMLPRILQVAHMEPDPALSLDVRLLRYRPHSRAVVQYTLRGAEGDGMIGKLYRSRGKARRMWRLLEAIDAASATEPVIPAPLAQPEGTALVLMARAPGRSLTAILAAGDGASARSTLQSTARALRRLHAMEASAAKLRTPGQDVAGLVGLAARIREGAEAPSDERSFFDRLEAMAAAVTRPEANVLSHGGFKPTAVLVAGDDARFIDLDSAVAADPARDVGCFTSKLRAMSLTDGTGRLDKLADVFVAGYCDGRPDADFARRLRFYEALYLYGLGLKHLHTSWQGSKEGSPAPVLCRRARAILAGDAA